MSTSGRRRSAIRLAAFGLVAAGVVSVFTISGASAARDALAQAASGPVREAQVLDQERTGVASPVGLAFSPASSAFYVVGAQPGALPETDVAKLTPFALSPTSDRAGSARIAAAVQDPINMAFDARGNRLLLLGRANALFEVRVTGGGDIDRQSLNRRDAARFGLQDPQGVAVDPASGAVFILDVAQPRIVRVEPASDGSFAAATISEIDLRPSGLSGIRGLAFDPGSGHLHLGSGRNIVELTTDGVVVAMRDLSELALTKSEGLVLAPSGDQTDAPTQLSLYVADSGTAPTAATGLAPSGAAAPAPSAGQIVELSLAPQAVVAAATFTASLVNTIDTGAYNPPSPDPSGLTYLPQSNTLLMTDGEVEETVSGITHFQGVNVWETTLTGNVVDTANVSHVSPVQVSMTNEPVGVTWKPGNGHFFITEDGGKRVYDLNPGADGRIGPGDTFTFFGTNTFGNGDPEGITYNPVTDRLFVCDGVNAQIYEYTTGGSLVSQFDTAQYGVLDPETVEFNSVAGTLFVLSNRQSGPIIIETTTSGALLNTINVSGASPIHRPAGLAYAPASNGSGVKRFYWVDREIDNNNDPRAVDGKMFEFTAPGGPPPPPNNPPVINSDGGGTTAAKSVPENTTAVTDVNATDPDAGDTLSYSISGVDAARFSIVTSTGVLTFVTAPDFENPTDAGLNNVYDVTVSVSDGNGGSDSQAIAVTVTNVADTNQPPQITSDGGGPSAAFNVPENTTAVTNVDATDPDAGDTLTYSISGTDAARFTIDGSSGVLTFASAPNFEGPTDADLNNVYDVTVSVSDGNGGSDSQAIAVTVTNVNEFLPGITSDGGGTTAALSKPENSTAVTDVNATDGDGDTLTYSISGGADATGFAINSSDGVLTFATPPNFEAPRDANLDNVYDVIVRASDGTFSDTQEIAVTVTNVPEAPAITSDGGEATAAKSVPENSTAVTDVNAIDGDGDALTYSISGGVDALAFSIDNSTGVLTFVSPPDFESPSDDGANNVYDVIVQVSDGSLSDTQAIAVTVTDVLDTNQPPVITSDGGEATAAKSVPENQMSVTDVDATDANPGDTLVYSISGGADAAHFTIVPSSGVLTFVVAPDFETPTDAGTNNVYDVIVQVSDGFLSDTQAIAVTVLGVNEFPPVITSDGGEATAAKSVAENQTAVTDVDATDGDGDPLTYSIAGGADATSFTIVPATGVLTFVSAPNFEAPTDSGANNVYDVTVQASDGTTTDTQAIAVTVTNVAETPVINSNGAGDNASVSVAENQTAVTDVDASDGDGDTLTYSITGGADATHFTIVPTTGVLTFVSAPDFEAPTDAGANNVYDVIVQASDGSLSDTQAIAVTVTDVFESSTSLYFSLRAAATVGGVSAANEDVIFFDGTGFSLAFDGSDVGIASLRIDAFSWVDATRLLLSFDVAGTVPGIAGTVDDSDVVLFTATSLGAVTAGSFSMYLQGADVGLTLDAEDVDAVELLPNGHILLSTLGAVGVTGVSGVDEDLLEFIPTSLGDVTAGTFAMYFDGSDVGLNTTADEDVDAAAVDATGKIYLSTIGLFAVTGISGDDEDVFVFTPTSLGSVTAGTFSPTLYFDGSVHGLAANDVFAIDLP